MYQYLTHENQQYVATWCTCTAYLTIGLLDLGNVISLTGFRSHVLHSLRMYMWAEKEREFMKAKT